jgi:hypothetical protein
MQTGQPRKTLQEIKTIVGRISFMDRQFRITERNRGFMLQIEYYETDVDDPSNLEPVLQRARKWYISAYSTETEIVETAFKACRVSMDHVLKEHFLYQGRRVYSPHFTIQARMKMCDEKAFDGRIPLDKICSECKGERNIKIDPGGVEDPRLVPCPKCRQISRSDPPQK